VSFGLLRTKFPTKGLSVFILMLAIATIAPFAAAEIPSKWEGNYIIAAEGRGIKWLYDPAKIEKLSYDTKEGSVIRAVIKIEALHPFVTEFQELEIDPRNRIFRLVTAEAYDEAENLVDL